MKLAGTIRWMLFTVATVAAAGGGGAYWFLTRSDELLKAELLKHLAATFPSAEFSIHRANFDLSGQVRAYDVKLTFPGDDFASLSIAELVIGLNRDLLAESQTVEIERIRLVKPRAWVIRHDDGTWNWQQLKVLRQEGRVLPDLEIEHGTVTVQYELPSPQHPLDFNCTELKLTATPSSEQSFAIKLSARVDGAGPLQANGDFHLDGSPWKASVGMKGLMVDPALIGKVLTIRPELKDYLQHAQTRWIQLAAGEFPRDATAAANRGSRPSRAHLPSADPLMDLGVQLLMDLQAGFRHGEGDQPMEFAVKADVRNGRLTNKLLPLPLHDLTGQFYVDRSQVVIKELHGMHGESSITLSAKWSTTEPPVLTVKARHIAVDEALAVRMPLPLQKIIRSLTLRGDCNLDAQVTRTEAGYVPDVELSLSQGSLNYEKFPYPIRDVSGTLSWHGDLAHLEGKGLAGLAPVTATGTIKQPGPGAEMAIVLKAEDIPVDQTLMQASPEVVRNSIAALNARGTLDAWVNLIKPAGEGTKFTPRITAKVRDGSVMYEKFPLRIDRITGLVRWDGETAEFEKLTGRHADAEIVCEGSFQKGEPGQLELVFLGTHLPFDSELYEAIPPRLQDGWNELRPAGRFDAAAKLSWQPGGDLELKFPKVQLKHAELNLAHFPFPWNNVNGELSYERDELRILNLHAEHDDCRLRGKGIGVFPADLPWNLRFTEFFVDDLPTTPALRRALPDQLRMIVDALNPTGTVSIQGPIAFFGPNDRRDTVGIQWETDVLLSGSNLTLGQRIDRIHGRVGLHGSWDGHEAVIHRGELDLDSLEILEHQLAEIRGPFRYQQGELVAGSRQAAVGPVLQARNEISLAEQIHAKAIDGTLTFNSVLNFGDLTDYRLRILMIGGNLERYAQIYLNNQKDIRGNINGWIDLQGQGDDADTMTGSGYVRIEPAELYELPVFFQTFQLFGPQFQDRSAFKKAEFLFTVANQRFRFSKIDLMGNTIRLVGRGAVRFDGIVDLEFYSMLGRNQIPIPGVRELIGALSRGWVGVTVSGHISDPHVDRRAIPELDDALQQFLGAFDPRGMNPPTRLPIPRSGQSPRPNPR